MMNSEGGPPNPEGESAAGNTEALRIMGDDGQIYLVDSSKLQRCPDTQRKGTMVKSEPNEPTPPPEPGTPEYEQAIIQDCRAISDQVLMNHFPVEMIEAMHIQGKTEQEIDEAWKKAAREYLKKVTIHRHGKHWHRDTATGEMQGFPYGDLDGESAVGLLRMAGVQVEVNFVNAGKYERGRLNIDTGYEPGQTIIDIDEKGQKRPVEYLSVGAKNKETQYKIFYPLPDKLTVFWDHHGEHSPRDRSSTLQAYEKLTRLGLLDQTTGLDKAVLLVNEIDNGFLPIDQYPNSWQTIWGLAPEMRLEDIVDYFENGGEPDQLLTKNQLEKYHLIKPGRNIPREIQNYIKINLKERESMKREGRIVPSKYGALAIGKMRWEARGEKIAAILNFNGEKGIFFFSAVDSLRPETIEFLQKHGIPIVKSNMAVKNPLIVPGPIPFSLGEFIVDHLDVPESEIRKSATLKRRLNQDQERVEKLRKGK